MSKCVQRYVQGYHGLVKMLVTNVYYYQDELGSTSHIANASGALLEYYKYDLYGKPTYWSPSNSQLPSSNYQVKDLFTGQRWLVEIGLYDDRNRFMSPDLGRFLQPDPIGFKGDASNLYRYCGNDWANRTDPMGLEDQPLTQQMLGMLRDASVNCYKDYQRVQSMQNLTKDQKRDLGQGRGRSQVLLQPLDKNGNPTTKSPVLSKIFIGKPAVESRKETTGSAWHYTMKETPDKTPGFSQTGVGHMHADKTGNPSQPTGFSDVDKSSAAGKQGAFIGLINESDPKTLHVLNPQMGGGPARERTFDASTLEEKTPPPKPGDLPNPMFRDTNFTQEHHQ